MNYEQFWEDDIDLFACYYKAEQIRQKKRNNEMWIMGAYVYNAIGSLAPLLNGMSKNHKAQPYMKQPIPLTEDERNEIQRQKEEKFIAYLDRLAKEGKKDG